MALVFPDKQNIAREQNNVSYGIGDIVLYLKDVTENFKFTDAKYIDLDNGIREIVNKYYKSIGGKNPFEVVYEEDVYAEYQEGVTPKEAAVVDAGKITGKGVAKIPAPAKPTVKTVVAPAAVEETVVEETPVEEVLPTPEQDFSEKVDKFQKELDNRQFLLDDAEEDEKAELMGIFQKRLDGAELLAEEEDADEFDKLRYQMLKEFVEKNSK